MRRVRHMGRTAGQLMAPLTALAPLLTQVQLPPYVVPALATLGTLAATGCRCREDREVHPDE
ncbi:hypothetical protein [Streptomyces sp. NBC_00280]|uniref:hypothetical protein n=1 Tax=Streptomyces sp. NBC_00280 TaxID=2975699 RepID=UPI0032431A63